jgi:hypothetical protein
VRHYAARQRISDKRWEWTVDADDVIYASDPCMDHRDGHATKVEAERHYYDWMIRNAIEATLSDRKELCAAKCDEFTQKGFQLHAWSMPIWLCERHCFRETLTIVHPFMPDIMISTS